MAKLTEPEKQEIIRFMKAEKPLPDKYRFLLFEDKREVELVWNGKTNEVCNIVLPFQVIEQVDEPRAEKPADTKMQLSLFDLDSRGRQLKGWACVTLLTGIIAAQTIVGDGWLLTKDQSILDHCPQACCGRT